MRVAPGTWLMVASVVAGVPEAAARPPAWVDADPGTASASASGPGSPPPFARGRRIDGSGRHQDGLVALTFDDGPSVTNTPKVLATLAREGVPATFFIVGERIMGHSKQANEGRDLVRRELASGYTVGSHTVHHLSARRIDADAERVEVVDNEALLTAALGQRPWAFRPPYGDTTAASLGLLYRRGYTPVIWNVDGRDAFVHDAEGVRDEVMTQLGVWGGGVVLLHDIHPWTARALPLVLRALREASCERIRRGLPPYVIVPLERFYVPLDGPPASNPAEQAREEAYRRSVVAQCASGGVAASAPASHPTVVPASAPTGDSP